MATPLPNNVSVSDCKKRLWINGGVTCLARYSVLSGYEVYSETGNITHFKTGRQNETSLAAFLSLVKEEHNFNLEHSQLVSCLDFTQV